MLALINLVSLESNNLNLAVILGFISQIRLFLSAFTTLFTKLNFNYFENKR